MGWSLADIDAIADDITDTFEWIQEIIKIAQDEEKEIKKAQKKKR